MRDLKPFRVQVRRMVDDWLDVEAPTAEAAEKLARAKPSVLSVFPGSATPIDKPVRAGQPAIVQEEED